MQQMTSNQPYLLRAFFDWILDNGLTPYIVVSSELPGVTVPMQFVKDGQIVLNISPSACVNFQMDLERISFQARFSGQPMLVTLPTVAVGAIYAKENGAGTVFADAEELQKALLEQHESGPQGTTPNSDNSLKSVTASSSNTKQINKQQSPTQDTSKDTPSENSKSNTRPSLTVVK